MRVLHSQMVNMSRMMKLGTAEGEGGGEQEGGRMGWGRRDCSLVEGEVDVRGGH